MFYLYVLAPTLVVQSLIFTVICFCAKDKILKEWKIFLAPFLLSFLFSCGVLGASVIAVKVFTLVQFLSGSVYALALLTAQFSLFLCALTKDGGDLSFLVDNPFLVEGKNGDLDGLNSSQNSLSGLILRNRSLQNQAKIGIDLSEAEKAFIEAQKYATTPDDLKTLQNAESILSLAKSGGLVKKEDLSDAVTSLFRVIATKNCKKT